MPYKVKVIGEAPEGRSLNGLGQRTALACRRGIGRDGVPMARRTRVWIFGTGQGRGNVSNPQLDFSRKEEGFD